MPNNKLNAADYKGMRALYNRTGGDNWNNKTNKWDVSSDTPPSAQEVGTWHGVTVENSRVTEIKLGKNNLVGTIPSELGGLSSLQHLNLINNSLTGTIPSDLGGLSSLTSLRLHNNDLTGTIPSWLGSLTNLQTLGLSKNNLTGTFHRRCMSLKYLK
ncbi:MAG: hypothetical protein GDA56_22650 [Hormoscilla sp. GM7CHS1pb]|nr:hypothetical protein [Hormoscilla sp. GM7CHS1pb]